MIFIIIAAVVGFIFGKKDSFSGGICLGLAGACLGAMVSLMATLFFGVPLPLETTVAEHELAQMSDNVYADTSGEIRGVFLVNGTLGTNIGTGFTYYEKDGDEYRMGSAESNQSTIKYTSDKPKLVVEDTHCARTNPDGPAIGLWFFEMCDLKKEGVHYTFYIPEGSIAEGYRLGE